MENTVTTQDSIYTIKTKHEHPEMIVDQVVVMHSMVPGLSAPTVTAIGMLSFWDDFNCLVAHAKNTELEPQESLAKLSKSFQDKFSQNTAQFGDGAFSIEFGTVEELSDQERQAHLIVNGKLKLPQIQAETTLNHLFDFLKAMNTRADAFELQTTNEALSIAYQFILDQLIQGETEYNPIWLAEIDTAIKTQLSWTE